MDIGEIMPLNWKDNFWSKEKADEFICPACGCRNFYVVSYKLIQCRTCGKKVNL
jgi:ribosomal protein L37AE/L43A